MTKKEMKEELRQAMLAKDAEKTSTLRMVISALGYFEIEKGGAGYEATDEDVISVLQKQVKQRRDSIEQFAAGNRNDLVQKETKELQILAGYLPKEMDEEAIKVLITDAIAKTGATGAGDMGKVMGVLMPQVRGKADGSLVSKLVMEKLHE